MIIEQESLVFFIVKQQTSRTQGSGDQLGIYGGQSLAWGVGGFRPSLQWKGPTFSHFWQQRPKWSNNMIKVKEIIYYIVWYKKKKKRKRRRNKCCRISFLWRTDDLCSVSWLILKISNLIIIIVWYIS